MSTVCLLVKKILTIHLPVPSALLRSAMMNNHQQLPSNPIDTLKATALSRSYIVSRPLGNLDFFWPALSCFSVLKTTIELKRKWVLKYYAHVNPTALLNVRAKFALYSLFWTPSLIATKDSLNGRV